MTTIIVDLPTFCLGGLQAGRSAVLPRYDFVTSSRLPASTPVDSADVILFEGILAFYSAGAHAPVRQAGAAFPRLHPGCIAGWIPNALVVQHLKGFTYYSYPMQAVTSLLRLAVCAAVRLARHG